MERFGGSAFTTNGSMARKKRRSTRRRPLTDSHPLPNGYSFSPNDQNTLSASKSNRKDNGGFVDINASIRNGSENKVKKLKLKIGGVTCTLHSNSTTGFATDGVSFATNGSYSSDPPQPPKNQESLHRVPRKDLSIVGSGFVDKYCLSGKAFGEKFSTNEAIKSQSVRKSKRIPKKRVWDVGFSDDEEDEEIQYLERINASKLGTLYEDEEDESKRSWKKVKILKSGRGDAKCIDDMDINESLVLGRFGRTNPRSQEVCEDKDYMEEEEPLSDDELKVERKTRRKESVDLFKEGKKEKTQILGKRADHHAIKDCFSAADETLIDLPTCSLPAPHKKNKEKLSEVDQQLKKAEAAQRRRLQSEKADREAQAEAIRRILGQDSARKKREEKMKKQRDEVAQGKAANTTTLAPSTVRWVMGPTGTIVTFSKDIGLPTIFNSVPQSYPPSREKCVGPNCTNSYKYRDSKSKVPLCSLLCYRAIHKEVQSLIAR